MTEYEVGINFKGNMQSALNGLEKMAIVSNALGRSFQKNNSIFSLQNEILIGLGITGAAVLDRLARGADRYNRMLATLQNTTMGVIGAHAAMNRVLSARGPYGETSPRADVSFNQQIAGYFPRAAQTVNAYGVSNASMLNYQSARLNNLVLNTNLASGKQAERLTEGVVGNIRAYDAFVKGDNTSSAFLRADPQRQEVAYLRNYAGMASEAMRSSFSGIFKSLVSSPSAAFSLNSMGLQGVLGISTMAARQGVSAGAVQSALTATQGKTAGLDAVALGLAGLQVGAETNQARVAQGYRFTLPKAFQSDPIGYMRSEMFGKMLTEQTGHAAMTYGQFEKMRRSNPAEYARLHRQMLNAAPTTMGAFAPYEQMMLGTNPGQLSAIQSTKLTEHKYIEAVNKLSHGLDKLGLMISGPLIGGLTALVQSLNSVLTPIVNFMGAHPAARAAAGYTAAAGGAALAGTGLYGGYKMARAAGSKLFGGGAARGAVAGGEAATEGVIAAGGGEAAVAAGGALATEGAMASVVAAITSTAFIAAVLTYAIPVILAAVVADKLGVFKDTKRFFSGAAHVPAASERFTHVTQNKVSAIGAALDKQHNMPAGTMERLAMAESSGGINNVGPATPYGRAKGAWQIMPQNIAAWGITHPMDPKSEGPVAAAHLAKLAKHFGSWRKAVAAWNWNPNGVSHVAAEYGSDWLAHTPEQTQNEVNEVYPNAAAAMYHGLPQSVNHVIVQLRGGDAITRHMAKNAKVSQTRTGHAQGIHTAGILAGSVC